jgi:hypothetical protein
LRAADGKTNIAFTGVSDNPFRDAGAEAAVSGKALDNAIISAAADSAVGGVSIMSDHYASGPYRKHLAKVYLKKAFTGSFLIVMLFGLWVCFKGGILIAAFFMHLLLIIAQNCCCCTERATKGMINSQANAGYTIHTFLITVRTAISTIHLILCQFICCMAE